MSRHRNSPTQPPRQPRTGKHRDKYAHLAQEEEDGSDQTTPKEQRRPTDDQPPRRRITRGGQER